MELEEMKALWGQMSAEVEKQKAITDSLVIKMTRAGYRNKISKVQVPETIGAFFCAVPVLYILINIQQLNTWYLLGCGISSVIILFLLCFLSLRSISKISGVNISKNNYKESLLQYSKAKMQFVSAQKVNFYLSAILMLVILPVMSKLIAGKDVFKQTDVWLYYVIAFPFFYPFSRWVFKRYVKIVSDAENILKELE